MSYGTTYDGYLLGQYGSRRNGSLRSPQWPRRNVSEAPAALFPAAHGHTFQQGPGYSVFLEHSPLFKYSYPE